MPTEITAIAYLVNFPTLFGESKDIVALIKLDEGHHRPVWLPVTNMVGREVEPMVPANPEEIVRTGFRMLARQVTNERVDTIEEINEALKNYFVGFTWFREEPYDEFEKLIAQGLVY